MNQYKRGEMDMSLIIGIVIAVIIGGYLMLGKEEVVESPAMDATKTATQSEASESDDDYVEDDEGDGDDISDEPSPRKKGDIPAGAED